MLYAGVPLAVSVIDCNLPRPLKKSPRFLAHVLYCVLLDVAEFSSLFRFTLKFIKDHKIVYNYPLANPAYGNRREITSIEDLAIASSRTDWQTEKFFQQIIISERVLGKYSIQSLTSFERLLFHCIYPQHMLVTDTSKKIRNFEEVFELNLFSLKQRLRSYFQYSRKNMSQEILRTHMAHLICIWLDKLKNVLLNDNNLKDTTFFQHALSLVLPALVRLIGYNSMVKILTIFAVVVNIIFDKKLYIRHCHYTWLSFYRSSGATFLNQSISDTQTLLVDISAMVVGIANFVCDLVEHEIVVGRDMDRCLQSIVTSCECHYNYRSRSELQSYYWSTILFTVLRRSIHIPITELDITKCQTIIKYCSKDVINIPDCLTKTSLLHFAVESNSELLVRFLLANGAHPDAVDCNGDTPKDMAVSKNSQLQWIFEPDRLSCIACRTIVQESIPYKELGFSSTINRQIMLHDKNRFSEYPSITSP